MCNQRQTTTASLDPNAILVLFSFVCICAIVGLSIWIMKLNKRLKQYEDTNLRNSQNATNSDNSCFCEFKNHTVLSKDITPDRHTLKVLATNMARSNGHTKSTSCANERHVQLENIHQCLFYEKLHHNNGSSIQSLRPASSNK